MFVRGLRNTRDDRVLEREMIRIVLGVQTRLFDKLPEALNQMQIRRVGGQEQQRDAQPLRQTLHQRAPLIAGIGEHDRERHSWMGPRQ